MTYTDEFGHRYHGGFHDRNCPQCAPRTAPIVIAPGDLIVPMRQYFRPNGQSKSGFLIIPGASTSERKFRLMDILTARIEFTLEAFPGRVNLCLDDTTFDYKFEVVEPEQVNNMVLRFIDEFDLAAYNKAADAYHASEPACDFEG